MPVVTVQTTQGQAELGTVNQNVNSLKLIIDGEKIKLPLKQSVDLLTKVTEDKTSVDLLKNGDNGEFFCSFAIFTYFNFC